MKNKLSMIMFLYGAGLCYAQNPIGTPPVNPNNAAQNAASAWYRGGNNPIGIAANNNIFGTAAGFNSPIYTETNGKTRAMWSTNAPFSGLGMFGKGDGLRIFNPAGVVNLGNLDFMDIKMGFKLFSIY